MISKVDAPLACGPAIPYVRRLKADRTIEIAIAAAQPQWIFCHYNPAVGQKPCEAKRDKQGNVLTFNSCKGCLTGQPERRRGYLWMWNFGSLEFEFFEITEWCWRTIVLRGIDQRDMIGLRIKIHRGKGDRARFKVDLISEAIRVNVQTLQPEPDCEPSVRKIMQA